MTRITLAVLVGICVIGIWMSATGFMDAMDKCMEKHSRDTCISSLR